MPQPLAAPSDPDSTRWGWLPYLAGAGAGLGLLGVSVLSSALVYLAGVESWSPGAYIALDLLVWMVLVIAVAAWAWPAPRRRRFAIGTVGGSLLGLAVLAGLVLVPRPQASDPVDVAARLGRYQARVHYTVYDLGPRFQTWPLNDADHDRSGRVDALYGTCSGSDTCGWPMDVINTRGLPPLSSATRCHLLSPRRGVPVVRLQDDVLVFTGRSTIQLSGDSTAADLAAVRALRPVGRPRPTGDLPRPPATVLSALQHVC